MMRLCTQETLITQEYRLRMNKTSKYIKATNKFFVSNKVFPLEGVY
jgi:hypothetical protein